MKLLAIDGNSILNRSFYGVKPLSSSKGVPTNAIVGFLNTLLKIENENNFDYVCVAFDVSKKTFRNEIFSEYKATRKLMPDDLASQLPLIKQILNYLGYNIVEKQGYEGDDVLGTVSNICNKNNIKCIISTGDRDCLQLVNENVNVRLSTTKEVIFFDTKKVEEVYSISPEHLLDVKALMGDSSDNIPGVKGIGEKTAFDLIRNFKSIENLYENIENATLSPRQKQLLIDGKQMAIISKNLGEIKKDTPLEITIDTLLRKERKSNELLEILNDLNLNTFIDKFNLSGQQIISKKAVSQKQFKVIIEPEINLAKEMLEKAQKLYFIASFEQHQINTLKINLGDSILIFKTDAKTAFLELIVNSNLPKVTCEVKTLYRLLLSQGIDLEGVSLDTSLIAYLLDVNAKEYSLTTLKNIYLTEIEYIIEDENLGIACLIDLSEVLLNELSKQQMDKLYFEIELPLSKVLADMEVAGFVIDIDGVKAFGNMLENQIEAIKNEIYEITGEQFNINSPKILGEILFEKLMLPAMKKTKSGYSTDADVLESLIGKHPIIEKIIEYRKLTKLNSTYVVGLLKVIGDDNRIHTVFKQTETRTGRISSTEPNMQNIPVRTKLGSEMRKFFVAKKGYKLIDADYSQIELRILAHISNDLLMIDAFNNNEDIHTATASEVFGIPKQLMPPETRNRAKAINFGIVYGISAFSLSQDIGVTVSQAKKFIEGYLDAYSGVARYMKDVVNQAKQNGYATTAFNRKRYLPELSSNNKNIVSFGERVALNMPIQGTAADIIKIAMVRVHCKLKQEKLDAKLILQVHDELLIEAKEEIVEKVQEILKTEMENAVDFKVKMLTKVCSGDTWYDTK